MIQRICLIDGFHNLCAAQCIPIGRNDRCSWVAGTNQLYAGIQFFFFQSSRVAENDTACIFNLVVEEFTEVLLIHFALLRIDNCCKTIQCNLFFVQILYGTNDITQLADARRLNQNAVWCIGFQYLFQSCTKITNQTTADATGIHFCNGNSSILQESAIDANFSEFIFNENQLFILISFCDQLLY